MLLTRMWVYCGPSILIWAGFFLFTQGQVDNLYPPMLLSEAISADGSPGGRVLNTLGHVEGEGVR